MAVITPEVYTSMGLNEGEYARIVELLQREPTYTELGMFAVMWSEHCGYKYSRPVLALFKKYREAMEGAGLENAGIVEIGDGLGVTMKVESHNHPSAVEPYQGAATGVGGIIRDILTMGARPIASLNSLRFGPIQDGEADPAVVERNRFLFEHVVAGIAGYGNCVGVPTVAGEVQFHPRYSGNPLVNAMCVGILPMDGIATAAAAGPGNPVIYLGSATGKDGIHGATFASDALGEDNQDKRPNVQIGDPFAEKLLIEATLEALKTGAVVAIQDMGAAGLTCSTVEMASKGKVGMKIDLDRVPMRESDMSAYELMLSESQERMLAVAAKGREQEVLDIFRKWGVHAVVIGEVTDDGRTTVTRRGKTEVCLDPTLLTDHCPTYTTPEEVPDYHRKALAWDPSGWAHPDPNEALTRLMASPNLASKRWVFRQYDQQVQTQTVLLPGEGDAAVLHPRGTDKGLAVKIDGNGRQVYFDPRVGGQLAVVEAARNVACTGARPVAITDGLNFGNPQRPHVYWQFRQAVIGIAEAAEAIGTPVISGNVSFYNESDLGEVLPTPLIGMLGVLEKAEKRIGCRPTVASGLVVLLRVPLAEMRQFGLGASEYAAEVLGVEDGVPVAPDLDGERRLADLLVALSASGDLDWAHDVSDGGLAFAAAEVAVAGHTGVHLELSAPEPNTPAAVAGLLFGEVPGVVLVGVRDEAGAERVLAEAARRGIDAVRGGNFGGHSSLTVSMGGTRLIEQSVETCRDAIETSIPTLMRH
ncbi:MAG: phosphoribosylformylglycinamidine synthase subunit PurL [Fimbriimonadaceae bacterium]